VGDMSATRKHKERARIRAQCERLELESRVQSKGYKGKVPNESVEWDTRAKHEEHERKVQITPFR